jgi:hypothetical protein
MSQPVDKGGLGLGTMTTSYIFLGAILALVVFLSITRRDETPPEVVAEELSHEYPHPHPHSHRRPHTHPHRELVDAPATETV